MNTQLKRLDRAIAALAQARNTMSQNPEVEYEVDKLIGIVEVAVTALADEVEDEVNG